MYIILVISLMFLFIVSFIKYETVTCFILRIIPSLWSISHHHYVWFIRIIPENACTLSYHVLLDPPTT